MKECRSILVGTLLLAVVSACHLPTASTVQDVPSALPQIDRGIWTEHEAPGAMSGSSWGGITSSADGTRLAAVIASSYYSHPSYTGGYIYTSTDGGATWAERTAAGWRDWRCITGSADGARLAAAAAIGYIYTSDDGGAS